jgi:hypothetical protein
MIICYFYLWFYSILPFYYKNRTDLYDISYWVAKFLIHKNIVIIPEWSILKQGVSPT